MSLGQTVVAGQQLGIVGSSGCSTQPHLHLETLNCEGDVVDPFQEGLFLDPPAYDPAFGHMETVLLDGGFSNNTLAYREQMLDPTPNATTGSAGEPFGFGVHMGGGLPGDTFSLRFRRPNGSLQTVDDITLGDAAGHRFWLWTRTLDGQSGQWEAQVLINGTLVASTPFQAN